MTPEEQRILIAEACGYVPMYIPGNFKEQVWHIPGGSFDKLTDCRILQTLPDYLNDLNAMHEAEKVLDERQRWLFVHHYLNDIVERKANCETGWFANCHATAAQRAEAFLRTLSLWQE